MKYLILASILMLVGCEQVINTPAPAPVVQPFPVYIQPAPVYIQPRPVYVQPYYQPRPIFGPIIINEHRHASPPIHHNPPSPIHHGGHNGGHRF